jgi:hypothetical protein
MARISQTTDRNHNLLHALAALLSDAFLTASFHSSVGIETGYGLDGRGSIPDRGKRFVFSTPQRPDRLRSPLGTGRSFREFKEAGT